MVVLICSIKETTSRYFPGSPVVKNPPCNAGVTGLTPGPGTKIPHATGQPSSPATATESTSSKAQAPQLVSPWAAMKDARWRQNPACCNQEPTQPNKKSVRRAKQDGGGERTLRSSALRSTPERRVGGADSWYSGVQTPRMGNPLPGE